MKSSLKNWDDLKLNYLQDPEVARGYLEACLDEGVPLSFALGEVIKAQGVTKVSKKARMAVPNVIRATRKNANPTYQTLIKLLKTVGLGLTVRPLRAHSLQRAKA